MNINTAKGIIEVASVIGDTVLMQGAHGIGKSQIVKQFAKENNHELIELFLSHQEVGDVIGIPTKRVENGEELTVWTKPIWLQRLINAAWPEQFMYDTLTFKDEAFAEYVKANTTDPISRESLNTLYMNHYSLLVNKLYLVTNQDLVSCSASREGTLFLDELNRAPIDVRQSALQLVLEKAIHEHELPYVNGKPTMIVAAVNPAGDYQVDELDPALLDRFTFIEVEADLQAWLDYAKSAGINEVVREFIMESPERLHFQPKNGGVGSTPRSWEVFAKYADKFEDIPAPLRLQVAKGRIGTELATQFIMFYESYSKVIKLEDIEKFVSKESKKTKDPMKLAPKLAKLIENQEAIQKTDMAENLLNKYIDSKSPDDALPLMAYLYAIPLEICSAFIKKVQKLPFEPGTKSNIDKLAALDLPQGKELFLRLFRVKNDD